MDLTPLHRLARTRYGAIGRHQLGSVGITPSRRRSLVTRGILVHSIGDSFGLFEVSRSREHLAAAATLAWGATITI